MKTKKKNKIINIFRSNKSENVHLKRTNSVFFFFLVVKSLDRLTHEVTRE